MHCQDKNGFEYNLVVKKEFSQVWIILHLPAAFLLTGEISLFHHQNPPPFHPFLNNVLIPSFFYHVEQTHTQLKSRGAKQPSTCVKRLIDETNIWIGKAFQIEGRKKKNWWSEGGRGTLSKQKCETGVTIEMLHSFKHHRKKQHKSAFVCGKIIPWWTFLSASVDAFNIRPSMK